MATSPPALQLSESECTEILQAALKTQDVILIDHKLISNTPNGFNGLYYNVLLKYKLSVLDEIKELSCFLKSVPRNDRHLWYINGTKLLLKEYEIYEDIIPAMQKYVNYKIPVPECYLVRYVPHDQFRNIMVMEDLNVRDFTMRNPREAMGIEECTLVMQTLAKFHAGTVVLEERSGRSVLELCKHPEEALWSTDPANPSFPWVRSCIDTLIELAEKIPKFKGRITSNESQLKLIESWNEVVKIIQISTKHVNVICHGDIWSNNIMFQYKNNKLIDVLLLDLQVYRYSPPITDVLMFIYLNTTRSFRKKYKDSLLFEYSDTLKSKVEEAGCRLPTELSLQGLKELEKEFTLFALVSATGYVPMGQLPPEARIKNSSEGQVEGARDFDVLADFLNSRSEQVWRGMQMDEHFSSRVNEAMDELFSYIGL